MKKTYQTPKTLLTYIEMQQIIAASNPLHENNGVLEQQLSDEYSTNATSGNLSRRSVWDDEENDEME